MTYKMSIHGEAIEKNVKESPVCTDCHGEHTILSPSETDSSVFASNVSMKTCAPCHSSERIIAKYALPTTA